MYICARGCEKSKPTTFWWCNGLISTGTCSSHVLTTILRSQADSLRFCPMWFSSHDVGETFSLGESVSGNCIMHGSRYVPPVSRHSWTCQQPWCPGNTQFGGISFLLLYNMLLHNARQYLPCFQAPMSVSAARTWAEERSVSATPCWWIRRRMTSTSLSTTWWTSKRVF